MPDLRRVCVYCGSRPGARSAYLAAGAAVGRVLAEAGVGVVYGGGSIGVMGAVADAALAAGGEVVGVIPHGLVAREVDHGGLTRLVTVRTMHERKAAMARLSDAFVALPGGLGTLEELTETWTWAQLGIHRKPLALVNVGGYFDGLLAFLDHAVAEGFVRPAHRAMLLEAESPEEVLAQLHAYEPPDGPRWLDPDET